MKALLAACACAWAVQAQAAAFIAPDFDVRIEVSPRALGHLAQHKQALQASLTFADFYGVGMKVFGTFQYRLAGNTTLPVRDLKFPADKLKTLRVADYEVHIDLGLVPPAQGSGGLECEFLQERISQLQRKTHTLRCDLPKP